MGITVTAMWMVTSRANLDPSDGLVVAVDRGDGRLRQRRPATLPAHAARPRVLLAQPEDYRAPEVAGATGRRPARYAALLTRCRISPPPFDKLM